MTRMKIVSALVLFVVSMIGGCRNGGPDIPPECRAKIEWYVRTSQNGEVSMDEVDEMVKSFCSIPEQVTAERCFREWVRCLLSRELSGMDYRSQGLWLHRTCAVIRQILIGMKNRGFAWTNLFIVQFELVKWFRTQLARWGNDEKREKGLSENDVYGECRDLYAWKYQMYIYAFEEILYEHVRKELSNDEYARVVAEVEQFLGRKPHTPDEMWKAQGEAMRKRNIPPDALFALYGTTNAPAAKKDGAK